MGLSQVTVVAVVLLETIINAHTKDGRDKKWVERWPVALVTRNISWRSRKQPKRGNDDS